jgi:hypothetical protein
MNTLPIFGFYAAPAFVLFGITIAAVRFSRAASLLPVEYAAWLLPGLVYWLIPLLMYEARWHGIETQLPAKSLANLIEPVIVAVLCWVVFVGRIAIAKGKPQINRQAAYWSIGVSVAIGIAVLFLMPALPE